MKFTRLAAWLGILLVLGGAGMLLFITISRGNAFSHAQPAAPATLFPANYHPTPTVISGHPVSLSIPSLNINIPVIDGTYNPKTKTWTLSLDKVQYAVMTPPPNNESGNTFIYGHYRKGVFSTLHNIPANSEATITTDNGHTFYYRLAGVRVTTPQDSSLFNYKGKPILTVQTCTGLFFQNRQLFTFNFEKVV